MNRIKKYITITLKNLFERYVYIYSRQKQTTLHHQRDDPYFWRYYLNKWSRNALCISLPLQCEQLISVRTFFDHCNMYRRHYGNWLLCWVSYLCLETVQQLSKYFGSNSNSYFFLVNVPVFDYRIISIIVVIMNCWNNRNYWFSLS